MTKGGRTWKSEAIFDLYHHFFNEIRGTMLKWMLGFVVRVSTSCSSNTASNSAASSLWIDRTKITGLKIFYCYFLLKIVDLLDTIFIVLNKNNTQLSSSLLLPSQDGINDIFRLSNHPREVFIARLSVVKKWNTCRRVRNCWLAHKPSLICVLINSLIHVCMFLTTLNHAMKTSAWKNPAKCAS